MASTIFFAIFLFTSCNSFNSVTSAILQEDQSQKSTEVSSPVQPLLGGPGDACFNNTDCRAHQGLECRRSGTCGCISPDALYQLKESRSFFTGSYNIRSRNSTDGNCNIKVGSVCQLLRSNTSVTDLDYTDLHPTKLCVNHAHCDLETKRCICNKHYQESSVANGTCLPVRQQQMLIQSIPSPLQLGQPCTNLRRCDVSKQLQCINGTCQCYLDTYSFDSALETCVETWTTAAPDLSTTPVPENFNRSCNAHRPCATGLSCYEGLCRCKYTNQILIDGSCRFGASGPCSSDMECDSNAYCSSKTLDSVTGEHKCVCKDGYLPNSQGFCAADFGTACEGPGECDDIPQLACVDGKCQCPVYAEFNSERRICLLYRGSPCQHKMECISGTCVPYGGSLKSALSNRGFCA